MKSVLINVQPYWVFLIIAKKMGWNIDKEKTVEVRKNRPKDENWDKIAKIYCSKDKKSFARIPKEYQPVMKRFLGKVIGEFVCDELQGGYWIAPFADFLQRQSCLSYEEIINYSNGKPIFSWHISNLVIYDNPKRLSDFRSYNVGTYLENGYPMPTHEIKRPPQSWCYIKE